jgi:hypothetical protein
MKRYLTPAPETYHLNRLSAEIRAAMPEVLCVNEVVTDQKYIAAYTEDGVTIDEQALAAIVLAHDPTPPIPEPSLDQRIAEAEEALSVLFDELAALRPGGDN